MITNWKNTSDSNRLRRAVVALTIGVLVAINSSAQTQTQRKPKTPPPPSYDEVMQRALSQKKAVTNVATGKLQTNTIPTPVTVPASTPQTPTPTATVETTIASPQPSSQPTIIPAPVKTDDSAVKSSVSPEPPTSPPQTAPVAASPAVPSTSNPVPASVPKAEKPAKTQPKGPVFSPLPPDLAPTNAPPKSKSASADSISPDATKSMESLDDKHLLAIGDRLSFRILEDEEESKSLVVADSGELELPNSLGRFAAKGKSCKELARVIKAELDKEYYYDATVIIAVDLMARSRGKVYLAGAVRMPGPREVLSDEALTLSKAILLAGDFTDFADKKAVKVTRKSEGAAGGDQTFIVNVAEIVEKGRKESDLALQPDDFVYVPERLIRF